MDLSLLTFALIALLGLAGACSRFIPGWKTDNKAEELIETILKAKTGMNIDLSPDTPDPDLSGPDRSGSDRSGLDKKKEQVQVRSIDNKKKTTKK